jgi:hypothetical protein
MKILISSSALVLASSLVTAGQPDADRGVSLYQFTSGNPDGYQGTTASSGAPVASSLDEFNRGNPDFFVTQTLPTPRRDTGPDRPLMTSLDIFNRGNPDHHWMETSGHELDIHARDALATSR